MNFPHYQDLGKTISCLHKGQTFSFVNHYLIQSQWKP